MILSLILLAFFIELIFRPRIGFVIGEKLLLWYGKTTRKYILIFDINWFKKQ